MNVKIDDSWKEILSDEFEKEYFKKLVDFIKNEYQTKNILPKAKNIFNAFNLCPFDKLKVVIIGQDPYHGQNQAHGLSFSVQNGITPPPSLKNIFKELESDLQINVDQSNGNLERWAEQGVLLLNAVLTVIQGKPSSHKDKGWEIFTDEVIKVVSSKKEDLVFILWGAFAQKKEALINESKHLIIKSAHPSPYSADRGFFGSKPFSRTNAYLKSKGKEEINWG